MKKDILIAVFAILCLGLEVYDYFHDKEREASLIMSAYKSGWQDGVITSGHALIGAEEEFTADSIDFKNYISE